ncbi:MAG: 5-formyltetrahydrofolate cyclo-ligase [Erythrobacter sp.]|uniref:5-formyltetrahydrofolate cyclo-ligase n=1 Tax=Erythrobacter sp. TaxID=1042 RepID=UPI002623A6C5|nr:5-formyltetrahydrofolate cyclo-ligase [Erythrobacter sp.]MDJ0977418.1 5-formyltetrahydrofolate cyclo-ligase [Erythrobacter sp.]
MTIKTKAFLRKELRAARQAHVAALPDEVRGLLFHTPPRPLLKAVKSDAVIGVYHATSGEAPAAGYARFFHEHGHPIALPFFASRDGHMTFRTFSDPHAESDLEYGPFGTMQPTDDRYDIVPDVLFVPLVGFTASGKRLGQGGGHYDRWLAEHREARAIGLAWDVQLIEPEDALPTEPHDIALDAVITPTRIYGNL